MREGGKRIGRFGPFEVEVTAGKNERGEVGLRHRHEVNNVQQK